MPVPEPAKPSRLLRRFAPSVILVALAAPVHAAGTYYVDAASSNCSSRAAGTQANPYCTIQAALNARAGAGTTILVKPGIYREQVTVSASGASGSPLVIQALGSGVVIDGADDLSGASRWTLSSGNVWFATGVSIKPSQVFKNGVRLAPSSATLASLPANSFQWVKNQKRLYVNAGGGNPGLQQIHAGARTSGFVVGGRSHVRIEGFTITRAQDRGVVLQSGCSNVTLARDTVTFCFGYGVQIEGGSANRLTANRVADNGDHGIVMTGGATGCTVEDNECARNVYPPNRQSNGIYCEGSSANVFQRNNFHDNQDSGLQLQQGANDNLCLQNLSWRNGDHGFDNLLATGNAHLGDVAWGNTMDGFSVEGTATGTRIVNCIAVENGTATNEFDLWVDAGSAPGFVSDDNVFWNSTSQPPVKFGDTEYASVAAFAAATGYDTRSFQQDPLFDNPNAGSFHLLAGSRAIDSANSGVAGWPELDFDGRARVDDPATANAGAGPIPYADRGAFEFLANGLPQPPNGVIESPGANVTIVQGQSVRFTASASDFENQTPFTYLWSFGGAAPGQTVEDPGDVTFPRIGTFTVTFTVTDASGASDPTPATRTITVTGIPTGAADGIHWTILGQTSVAFDWRGGGNTLRYGTTTAYGATATAVTPAIVPWSSNGPFWEAKLTGLTENTLYHYSIDGGADHTFRTPPPRGTSGFVAYAEADIGDTTNYARVGPCQTLVAQGAPRFVLMPGDLSYANANGINAVNLHFNNVMKWSRDAAYMPAWGNHEWDDALNDDLKNYKGRFELPNPQASPGAPPESAGGEDWSWFDYGNVRFIAYPEPYTSASWSDWNTRARTLMSQAQSDAAIRWIVTYGHRPAYSSGNHEGDTDLKDILDRMGDTYSKYVLNVNGHSHDWERTYPQHGVVHLTSGTGGATLEEEIGSCLWFGGCPAPAYTAFRAMHHAVARLTFSATAIVIEGICGPAGDSGANQNDVTCTLGSVFDRYVIGSETPDRAPVVVAPATVSGPEAQELVVNVTASDPDGHAITSLTANLAALPSGNNATFVPAAGNTAGTLRWTPAFADSGRYDVTFTATNALAGTATTTLRVTNVDRAPVAAAPAAVTIRAGLQVAVDVTAADPDGDAISALQMDKSALPSPNDAGFVPGAGNTSGRFTWIPAASNAGTWPVRFRAANALSGPWDTTAITVTIQDVAPVIAATPSSQTLDTGQPAMIGVTASDGDGDPISALTMDAAALPPGNDATFTAGAGNQSGTFRWTPSAADTGTFVVGFTATANGVSVTTSASIRVRNRPPLAAWTITPTTGNAPLEVIANASASRDSDGVIASYRFDFGDGTVIGPQGGAGASHVYAEGSWTATLLVTDDRGATASLSQSIAVAPAGGPNLCGNPSFETALSGWSAYQGCMIERVASAGAHQGGFVARVTAPAVLQGNDGINDSPNWVLSTPSIGRRYRFSAWVRSSTVTSASKLQIREYNQSVKVGSTVYSPALALSPAWQKLTADLVCGAAGSYLDFQVMSTPLAPGEVFEIDDVTIQDVTGTVALAQRAADEGVAAAPEGAVDFAPVVRPNPAKHEATLSFVLSEPGALRVRVYDASGRRVHAIDQPFAAAGRHAIEIGGADERGQALRSGVYLYRIDAPQGTRVGRFAIVR